MIREYVVFSDGSSVSRWGDTEVHYAPDGKIRWVFPRTPAPERHVVSKTVEYIECQ